MRLRNSEASWNDVTQREVYFCRLTGGEDWLVSKYKRKRRINGNKARNFDETNPNISRKKENYGGEERNEMTEYFRLRWK